MTAGRAAGPAAARIAAEIDTAGAIPFGWFMELALYDPEGGYYTAGAPRSGWSGDFVTSAEIDPAFGELWARAVEQTWIACGRPEPFPLIEIGPGEAGLASAVVKACADTSCGDVLDLHLVEHAPALRERQGGLLQGASVTWHASVDDLPAFPAACLLTNELLDNVPVEVVEMTPEGIRQRFVTAGTNGFRYELRPPDPEVAGFLVEHLNGRDLPVGQLLEVPLASKSLLVQATKVVAQGALVFIDYGDELEGLLERPQGTLLCYSRSGIDDDLLASPGTKDITAFVNWTSVRAVLAAAGFEVYGPRRQREILLNLGARDIDIDLRRMHGEAVAEGRGADALRALSRRGGLRALLDESGLGGLGVIVATRGIEPPAFIRS